MRLKREVKVGIFAVVILAGLYWGINFLRGQDLFNRYNSYYATYEEIGGIQKSSAVLINGFKVGVVSGMKYDPEVSQRIQLEFSIRSKYRVPNDSKARMFSDGIMGGKAIEIVMGDSDEFLHNGDDMVSEVQIGLLDVVGSKMGSLTRKVEEVMANIDKALISINTILSENTGNITTTLSNVADISGSLKNVVTSEEESIRGVIANLNALSLSLSGSSGKIERIIGNVESFSDSLKSLPLPNMVNSLQDAIMDLNAVMAKINSEDGTLGRLVSDDSLYESLASASGNLALLLEDIKANPERYLNISVFGNKNKIK